MPASSMKGFTLELFTRHLIAETLLYDEEYDLLAYLSLVDVEKGRERYVASFVPEEGVFLIEEATAWEDPPPEDNELGYAVSIESEVRSRHELPEETAEVMLMLATRDSLLPSLTVLEGEDAF